MTKKLEKIMNRADIFAKELQGLTGKYVEAMRIEFDRMCRDALTSGDWSKVVAHMNKMKG